MSEREQATEREERALEPPAAVAPAERAEGVARAIASGTPASRVLALQAAAGNRAVASLVAGARPLQRAPVQVRTHATEAMTGNRVIVINGAYEVEFSPFECSLLIKARIVPDAAVTADQVAAVKAQTAAAFENLWDNKFYFDDDVSHERFFLRVRVQYVDSGQHLRIRLRAGSGRDDQTTWFVDSNSTDRAHELSHQLGLRDEYIDPAVHRRRNAAATGVFQDHSILGDYYTEGIGLAEVKLRHGQELANAIGRRTRRRLTAALTGPFQGERLERWRGIRDAAAAGSAERTRAQTEVDAIESDMMIPQLRALVGGTP
jgi:hypothetical protein